MNLWMFLGDVCTGDLEMGARLHEFLRGPAMGKAEELSVRGSNGEERGRGWSRLRLRGGEEAAARVLASAGEPADGARRGSG